MKNHLKKTKVLKETILLLPDCQDMSEQEVRKNLLDLMNWERKIDDLTSTKETIDEETVSLDDDDDLKTEMEQEFDNLVDSISNKIKDLKLQDSNLGLHTLAPSKVKENVVYPENFSGYPGEDVYKFVREFKGAISADHVRTSDEVKTLLKHLKGDAKKTVGEHHKKLDDALDDLKGAFGNPRRSGKL